MYTKLASLQSGVTFTIAPNEKTDVPEGAVLQYHATMGQCICSWAISKDKIKTFALDPDTKIEVLKADLEDPTTCNTCLFPKCFNVAYTMHQWEFDEKVTTVYICEGCQKLHNFVGLTHQKPEDRVPWPTNHHLIGVRGLLDSRGPVGWLRSAVERAIPYSDLDSEQLQEIETTLIEAEIRMRASEIASLGLALSGLALSGAVDILNGHLLYGVINNQITQRITEMKELKQRLEK